MRIAHAALAATFVVAVAGCGGGSSGGGLGSTGSFCSLAAAEDKSMSGATSDFENDTPTQLQAYMTKSLAAFQVLEGAAPSSIKPSVQVIDNAFVTLNTALKNADYKIASLTPADVKGLESESVSSASDAVTGYLKSNCHLKNP